MLTLSQGPVHYHAMPLADVVERLRADLDRGLSEVEASERLSRDGANAIDEAPPDPAWRQFLNQFRELVVILLLVAGGIAAWLGEWPDTIAIAAIVIANALIGFVQQRRAESALTALRRLSSPRAKVVRDGTIKDVPARELVVGDRVELEAGDLIPADIRLASAYGLHIAESALTGESVPVDKDAHIELAPETPLADRRTMAYQGTIVAAGKARGLVVATGMNSELGRIAGLLQGTKPEPTPLQKRLAGLGRSLVAVCIALVAVISFLQIARGMSLLETLRLAVTLAVAAIPEGLPAVVTITLAIGLKRMVERHVLIRKLASVETLGSVTVICSDKTGTLTRNEMTVRQIFAGGRLIDVTGIGYEPRGDFAAQPPGFPGMPDSLPKLNGHAAQPLDFDADLRRALTIGLRCNNAQLVAPDDGNSAWRVIGDPTEAALIVAAAKASLTLPSASVIHEIPFDSDRKRMSLVARESNGSIVQYVKGAAERVLPICETATRGGRVVPLTPEIREEISLAIDAMAGRALRVIAVAERQLASTQDFEEKGLTFAGLVGMIDPPREEVKPSIAACRRAGIKPVMITGDHPLTAQAIARELKILGPSDEVLTGKDLEQLSDEQLTNRVERVAVFARVSPEHKLRVVRAWRSRGHVVAMTGDGVNDAPAVMAADIGVAMGNAGTDVTKQASAMVLMDDNFVSIVSAVEEGRTIYDNIKKSILYLLSGNANKLLVMFAAVAAGWSEPLLALQILWLNLVTDGLPALALGMEGPATDAMNRKPRSSREGLITRTDLAIVLSHGSVLALVSLFAFFFFGASNNLDHARVATFCVMGFSQLFYAFACRSRTLTCLQLGFFSNRPLLIAVAVSALLQVGVVLLPLTQPVFGVTRMPTVLDWGVILAFAALPTFIVEAAKRLHSIDVSEPVPR